MCKHLHAHRKLIQKLEHNAKSKGWYVLLDVKDNYL